MKRVAVLAQHNYENDKASASALSVYASARNYLPAYFILPPEEGGFLDDDAQLYAMLEGMMPDSNILLVLAPGTLFSSTEAVQSFVTQATDLGFRVELVPNV